MRKQRKSVIEIGKTYGQLTVLERSKSGKSKLYWVCKCSCGRIAEFPTFRLLNGVASHCRHCRWGETSKSVRMERHLLRRYKNGAKIRNLEFSLTDEEFFTIIRKPCVYCGKFRCTRNEHTREVHTIFNGIDRIDNLKGYTLENSSPCCSYCNQAKSNRNSEEFIQWAMDLYEFQIQKRGLK